ncbi:hypothetical protein MCGE09_00375 [Thaumarchaeota archaeon SCGC AB-539-E09]|nr:hypothetical protein MCGE09_00375 [Thaumarchaeota archaeon SCGC AB-539-E09]
MTEYLAYISCDTGFFNDLKGKYSILKFTLEPCEIWERNQHRGVANFTINFPFEGLPEKGLSKPKSVENNFRNQQIAIEEAKLFIAWLSVATRKPLDLSHVGFGETQHFGPSSHEPIDEDKRDLMVKIHRIKEGMGEGDYEKVVRPIYESYVDSTSSLKIPHDFPDLTRKLFSLPDNYQEMFLDSCLSYQYALINEGTLPSISLIALVNSVESFMRDEFSSGYCEELGKSCPHKGDVMKKFRKFFEDNLQYPLPSEKRKFINDVYGSRSNFVHNALLGSGPFRGPMYMSLGRGRELQNQVSEFKGLVNACMINWLMRT